MPRIYSNIEKPHRSWGWLWRWFKLLVQLTATIAVIYALTYSGYFNTKTVVVEGSVLTDKAVIATFVPVGQNILWLDKASISNAILKNQIIQSVAIYKGLPDEVKIVVTERQPAMLWQSGDDITVLDSDGIAFAKYKSADLPAADTPAGQLLHKVPQVYDTKSLGAEVGKPIVSPDFITFARKVQTAIVTQGVDFPIDRIEIANTTYEVAFISKGGQKVLLDTLADADVQIRNLKRLIVQKKVAPNSVIDLRINRWAFVS